MNSGSRRLALCSVAALAASVIAVVVGCSRDTGPPPQADAFLSYLQLSQQVATRLCKFKSADEYQGTKAQFDQAYTDLEALQVNFQALPRDEVERLTRENADLVRKTERACEQLARWHAKSPGILGQDWQRLDRALRDAKMK